MTKISAVIPTYNRSGEVKRAIESVLSQSYDDLECVVVDDGSTDQTEEEVTAIDDGRLKYISHDTNRGVSAARNSGVNASKGKYIAFLDSDDEWETEKIQKQVEVLQSKSSSWNAVYCDVKRRRKSQVKQFFDRIFPENIGEEGGKELIEGVISLELAVHAGSTLLAERESIIAAGGFNESMQRYEELEFLVRLLEEGKMAYINKELVTLHDSGYPKANLVEQEMSKFLQEVDQYLEKGNQNREKMKVAHETELAKAYLREGQWRKGSQHLTQGRISPPRNLASLIWAIKDGLNSESKNGNL